MELLETNTPCPKASKGKKFNQFWVTIENPKVFELLHDSFIQAKGISIRAAEINRNLQEAVLSLPPCEGQGLSVSLLIKTEVAHTRSKVIQLIGAYLKSKSNVFSMQGSKSSAQEVLINLKENFTGTMYLEELLELYPSNLLLVWSQAGQLMAQSHGKKMKKIPDNLLQQIKQEIQQIKPGKKIALIIGQQGIQLSYPVTRNLSVVPEDSPIRTWENVEPDHELFG